ncbi:UvrD-helicase domain-containing protein [Rhizobium cauense]|nr:UvrD-helicase domain-containing protein [Rhizobium cauense]
MTGKFIRAPWLAVRFDITCNPSIPVLLGSLFRYILVDEYQDTEEIQYAIVAANLRGSAGNTRTFIVGDPNHAIYGSLGGYAMTRRRERCPEQGGGPEGERPCLGSFVSFRRFPGELNCRHLILASGCGAKVLTRPLSPRKVLGRAWRRGPILLRMLAVGSHDRCSWPV